jgi:hypothetical protein
MAEHERKISNPNSRAWDVPLAVLICLFIAIIVIAGGATAGVFIL